jgi:diguanylate cyclase (GGDEF)-like protein
VPNSEVDPAEDLAATYRILKYALTAVVAASGVIGAVAALNFTVNKVWTKTQVPLWEFVTVGVVLSVLYAAFMVLMYIRQKRIWRDISTWRWRARSLESMVSNLEDLAYYDPITGLQNANGLEREFANAPHDNRCLILLDLKNFGQINKAHGHWRGDEYLRHFAAMLVSDSRRNEYVYTRANDQQLSNPVTYRRNGGDEFYVLLRGPIFDGLGYLNRLHTRSAAYNKMAEDVLHSPHPFGFRAGLIALGKDEKFKDAAKRVSTCLKVAMQPNSEYLVYWGPVQDDDRIPKGYDDARFKEGTSEGNIIATARKNFATTSAHDTTKGMVTFRVSDYPPAKDGALSVFSETHSHAPRIRALLTAAQQALQSQPGFVPVSDGAVALELLVYVDQSNPPKGDPTNYLGGVTDGLEDKSRRGESIAAHLGDLAQVWLYQNDQQIKQLSYREQPGNGGYEVTVRVLNS